MGEISFLAVGIFAAFVIFVIGLSFYLGRKAKSSAGYFAAGGSVPWAVNGISFAGDYLSAASFLGICGLIATKGYDGFLYSIGYLAGWIVALFVVAEPMKRLGKYTFTDALDSKFNSKGIQLAAAISTLAVSVFYLIPQMVGAGTLVTPLLGLPHWAGVSLVGAIVIFIVATAGMASTTYVQFLKGALLIIFSLVICIGMCVRGLSTTPDHGGNGEFYEYKTMNVQLVDHRPVITNPAYTLSQFFEEEHVAELADSEGNKSYWALLEENESTILREAQWKYQDGEKTIINGSEETKENQLRLVGNMDKINGKTGEEAKTGSVGPFAFLAANCNPESTLRIPKSTKVDVAGTEVHVYYTSAVSGNKLMRPGMKFKVDGNGFQKFDFLSLMLALFCGTAALPHILIRYYTVPSPACARKSTILAIAAIGFFYVLTLFLGLGALVNGAINPLDGNMSAPLLAKTFGVALFAIISAIAFATVLGTVSGLIVAASGAVAHDLMDRFAGVKMTDTGKVKAGKIAAVVVGLIAILLGIVFKGQNVSFLVGWAFSVAASANLPAILMLLFWKKTTAKGIIASIIVGIIASLGIILMSPDMYKVYGIDPEQAIIRINQPGLISIPLSFLTLIVISLFTQKKEA